MGSAGGVSKWLVSALVGSPALQPALQTALQLPSFEH